MKHQRNVVGSKIPELQNIQMRASESSAEIDAAQLVADYHIAGLQGAAISGLSSDRASLLKLQRDYAYISQICQSAVARLVDTSGAGGLNKDSAVNLNQAYMKGASAHLTMGWDANCVPYGKFLLGIEHQGLI